ncbi:MULTISPECIES: branched-chain amino acid ABC transporter substrate-binding protein [unclassified Frankia]|uniref:branched-chain amino acid ABC transporter substrate-binding protein n=1 Tax=unclassified Frankia TaxID=2632575 RepID=UPI002AD4064E|nr:MULTISPECIES: branched-chain amino acid ABC transporter substrate-binding protein [unclassified Frankia]
MARRTMAAGAVALLAIALTVGACGGGSSASGRPQYIIGFQGPLSGDSQQLGINAINGVRTAVDRANVSGQLPFTVRLVEADDQGTPEQGPTAAQKLIDNPDVIAVVGPMFSGATKASEPLYSQAKLLSVSPSATNPKLTSLGFGTFFRVIAPDTVQGAAAADYVAKALKAKKVFSLDDKSEYGTGLSTVLEKELAAQGVNVTHDGINPTKDYTSEATKIISEQPDVMFYSGYYPEFSLLTKALRAKGFTGAVMSGDGSNDDQFVAQAGAASAESAYLTCPCGDANSDPKAAGFVADFKRVNNGTRPGTYSGEAYDATNAIIGVLRKLGPGASREAVAQVFSSVDFEGVTKRVVFQPDGEIVGSTVYVYQVRGGKREVLGTTAELIKA